MDQLQSAIQATQGRITELEGELRREREFMSRLVPREISTKRASGASRWLDVLRAISTKPLRHEHVIVLIDEKGYGLSRGATRVWLNYHTRKGHLKRDSEGAYSLTTSGGQWLRASSA